MALRGIGAAAIAVAAYVFAVSAGSAHAREARAPSFILFAGTDMWHYGGFLYGGVLWSRAGLDRGGLAFKTLLGGGRYKYFAGDLQQEAKGTLTSAALLPGWRFVTNDLTVGVFVGPALQDYRLSPDDPGSHLRGFYVGGELAADIWYQPNAVTMAALNGAISSIGPTGYLHAAFGYRLLAPVFFGPEAQALWCGDYREFQFGGQVTGWHIQALDLSAGGGWAVSSDRRSGPYLRIGVDAQY